MGLFHAAIFFENAGNFRGLKPAVDFVVYHHGRSETAAAYAARCRKRKHAVGSRVTDFDVELLLKLVDNSL